MCIRDSNRSAHIALVQYEDGEKRYIIAPEGLKVGDTVMSGAGADIKPGNCLPVSYTHLCGMLEQAPEAFYAAKPDMRFIFIPATKHPFLRRWLAQHGFALLDETPVSYTHLAQGLLTDKYLHGVPADSRIKKSGVFLKESALPPERLAQIAALNELAAARGQTLAQMALSWVLKDSSVTSVLIGASRPQQIVENAAIVNAAPFTQQELDEIERIAAVR